MSRLTVLILALMILAGCAEGPPRPSEIEDGDMCALCKMAISEKRYAAELIDQEERVFKFDDIGCMFQFARERRLGAPVAPKSHAFVRDYGAAEWLSAETAHYVQSPEIPSPMASGLIAVADRARAEQYAAQFHGRVLALAEVWKP